MLFDILKTDKTVSVKGRKLAGLFFLFSGLAGCTGVFSNLASDGSLKANRSLAQAEYGIRIDPAVFHNSALALQRGIGRSMIGKPYQVKGKWYYPEENPNYSRIGRASWYGSDFHGKLTANGETFDMNHLTAAHPTMPLPSYARVTNLKNGASLVVRVNDRGPFAHNRIIDLSRRAAQLLGYQDNGLTEVKVDYVGPAPVHGQDDSYLLASYNPAHEDAGSTLFAYNGREGERSGSQLREEVLQTPVLPVFGPRIESKPTLSSAFAQERQENNAAQVFATVLKPAGRPLSFNGVPSRDEYISVGTFADPADARRIADGLGSYGHLENKPGSDGKGHTVYTVSLFDAQDLNAALRAAWKAGASEAFVVRPQ